jgi:hypothetical protein
LQEDKCFVGIDAGTSMPQRFVAPHGVPFQPSTQERNDRLNFRYLDVDESAQ